MATEERDLAAEVKQFELRLAEDEITPTDSEEKGRLERLYARKSSGSAGSTLQSLYERSPNGFSCGLLGFLSVPGRINEFPIVAYPKDFLDDDTLVELNDTFLGKCIRANFKEGFDKLLQRKSESSLDIYKKSRSGISPFFRACIVDNEHFTTALLNEDPDLIDSRERGEGVISAMVRRPSVPSMLQKGNATFENGDEKRLADVYEGRAKATNKPIKVIFKGPIERINALGPLGAKASTHNHFGVTAADMLRDPKKLVGELKQNLEDMFPILAKKENEGKGACKDEDEGTFFVRTSPVTLNSDGTFKFMAKAYNKLRTEEQPVEFTYAPKLLLIATLDELQKSEPQIAVMRATRIAAKAEAHAKSSAAARTLNDEKMAKLNAGFLDMKRQHDELKNQQEEIKQHQDEEAARREEFEQKTKADSYAMFEALAESQDRALLAQKGTQQNAVDVKHLKEKGDELNAYLLQQVEAANQGSQDAQRMVQDLKVKVDHIGTLTLVMYDELYEPKMKEQLAINALKQQGTHLHRFYRTTGNGLNTTFSRARNGMPPDEWDVASTAGKIMSTVANSGFAGKVVKTLGEFLSFAPILPALLKLAGEGLQAHSKHKKENNCKAVVNSIPRNQNDFCFELALKLTQLLQTELSYIPDEDTADKLAIYVQLLAFAELKNLAGKGDPDSPQFVDNLAITMVNKIKTSLEKHYKALREGLAKLKTQKPSKLVTTAYNAAQSASQYGNAMGGTLMQLAQPALANGANAVLNMTKRA